MAGDTDELLNRIAQLPEPERHRLMVELGRRYGLPDAAVVDPRGTRARSGSVGLVPDYRIILTAGTRGGQGGYGQGYGSYVLAAASGGPVPLMRLTLGERLTVLEAEYDVLISALQDLLARIGASVRKADSFTVEVCTASELMVSQVQGTWKTRDSDVRTRGKVARQLLERFRGYRLVVWPAQEVVRALGE